MAKKNFSEMEGNDNPVNTYLKAAEAEKEQNKDASSILSSITMTSSVVSEKEVKTEEVQQQAPVVQEVKTVIEPVAEKAEETAPVSEEPAKKILMNINLRESTKKQWKMFFLDHDLTMTQGIETAVEYLMSEVNKGNIRLTKGGITK